MIFIPIAILMTLVFGSNQAHPLVIDQTSADPIVVAK